MNLRKGKQSDIEAIFELWWASSKEHEKYSRLDILNPKKMVKEIIIKELRKCLRDKNHVFLIAEEGDQIVGIATGHIGERDEPVFAINQGGYIDEIYVLVEFRKKGIGKELLDELMRQLYLKEAMFIGLAVVAQNTAVEFYKRQGFKIKSHWMVKESKWEGR